MFTRRTITLSEAAADALDRTGNASQYIAMALEQRWSMWQQSLGHLLSKGWTQNQIVCAVQTLNGVCAVERGLYRVARAMIQGIRADIGEGELAAVLALAEEWWTGNRELRRVLLTPDTPASLAPIKLTRQKKRGRPRAATAPAPAVAAG